MSKSTFINKINLSATGIRLNDCELTMPLSTSKLIDCLEPPSRVLEGDLNTNTFLFWDNIGIYAIENTDSRTIEELSIAINNDENQEEYYPQKLFAGKLAIDNIEVTAETNVNKVRQLGFSSDMPIDMLLEKDMGKYTAIIEIGDEDEILSLGFCLSDVET